MPWVVLRPARSHPISPDPRACALPAVDIDGNGRITESEFIEWWNKSAQNTFSKKLHQQMTMTAANEVAIDKLLLDEDERKKA